MMPTSPSPPLPAASPPPMRPPRTSVIWPGSRRAPRRKRIPAPYPLERGEKPHQLGRPWDDEIGGLEQRGRGLVRGNRDEHDVLQPGRLEAAEGVEIRRVVAGVERPPRGRVGHQRTDSASLVRLDGRADLEHLAAPACDQAG